MKITVKKTPPRDQLTLAQLEEFVQSCRANGMTDETRVFGEVRGFKARLVEITADVDNVDPMPHLSPEQAEQVEQWLARQQWLADHPPAQNDTSDEQWQTAKPLVQRRDTSDEPFRG